MVTRQRALVFRLLQLVVMGCTADWEHLSWLESDHSSVFCVDSLVFFG